MRWFTVFIVVAVILLGAYGFATNNIEEGETYSVQKTIDFPVDKVYPQFNNLQNYARWNSRFTENPDMSVVFFAPYEGLNSAMKFSDPKSEEIGEMFVRYAKPNSTVKYQIFENGSINPFVVDVKFKALSGEKTQLIWYVKTPKQAYFQKALNRLQQEDWTANIDKSIANLVNLLSNKVDKERQLDSIKFDSLVIEDQEGKLLLGINVTTSNKRGALYPNMVLNHNKVLNYATMDLKKRDDEIGYPVLITNPQSYKDKEVSYFYGIPLAKRIPAGDNNFNFKTLNATKVYSIYFKGDYEKRAPAIQQLLSKAKKDSMRNGDLQQIFLKPPTNDKEVVVKFALPVYR